MGLFKNLKLENCATKNCSNKLHHLCQNNIDQSSYDGSFEKYFGKTFCCSECIGDKMKHIPPYCHDLFDDDTSEDEEEEDNSNEVVDEEEDQSNDVIEEEEENQ